jgi:hypothetical protein
MRASIIFAAALAAAVASAEPLYARTNETTISTSYYYPTGTGVMPPPTGSPNATVTYTTGVPPTPTGGDDSPTSPPGSGAAGLAAPVWVGALAAVAIGAFQL